MSFYVRLTDCRVRSQERETETTQTWRKGSSQIMISINVWGKNETLIFFYLFF